VLYQELLSGPLFSFLSGGRRGICFQRRLVKEVYGVVFGGGFVAAVVALGGCC